MKSPIAQNEIRKYLYPAPLDAKADGGVYAGSLIDDEVMADIASGEPAPWLILKIPHAKGLKDAIADALQSVATPGLDGAVLSARIAQGNSHTFEILIDDWSFDLPKTAQTFGRLDSWSAAWVTACIIDARMRAEPGFTEPASSETASSSTSTDDDGSSPPLDGGASDAGAEKPSV